MRVGRYTAHVGEFRNLDGGVRVAQGLLEVRLHLLEEQDAPQTYIVWALTPSEMRDVVAALTALDAPRARVLREQIEAALASFAMATVAPPEGAA